MNLLGHGGKIDLARCLSNKKFSVEGHLTFEVACEYFFATAHVQQYQLPTHAIIYFTYITSTESKTLALQLELIKRCSWCAFEGTQVF